MGNNQTKKLGQIFIWGVFIVIMLCCCFQNQEYTQNKFLLSKVEIRLVDYLGKDDYGCSIIENFDLDKKNEFVGIGVSLHKEFYMDSCCYGKQSTKGWKGTDEKINSLIITSGDFRIDTMFMGIQGQNDISFEKVGRVIGVVVAVIA